MIEQRGFAAVGLVNPKTRENVGSVLRAAGCYDGGSHDDPSRTVSVPSISNSKNV